MTVKRMQLKGDPEKGFVTTKPERIAYGDAIRERDGLQHMSRAMNWAEKTIHGVPIYDSSEGYLETMEYASLYYRDREYWLFERF